MVGLSLWWWKLDENIVFLVCLGEVEVIKSLFLVFWACLICSDYVVIKIQVHMDDIFKFG